MTSKNRGRPAKQVIASTIDNGNEQDSESGANAPMPHGEGGEGLPLSDLIELVQNCDDLIATAWHPDAVQDTINTNKSDVRLLKGNPAYQLSNGKIIKL